MTYAHGLTVQIGGTIGKQIRLGGTAIPVFLGCSYGTTDGNAPLTPKLINNFNEYVETFGWGNRADPDAPDTSDVNHDFTLDEVAWVMFKIYGVGPAVFINVYEIDAGVVDDVEDVTPAIVALALPLVEAAIVDLGIVPSHLLAPRYSKDATLKAAMNAITGYNGIPVMKVEDLDDDPEDTDSEAKDAAIVEATAITAANVFMCWPEFGGFPLSTIVMATALYQDIYVSDGVPVHTPSNKKIQTITRLSTERVVLSSWLTALNTVGVCTLKSVGSFTYLWGSQMAAYDSTADADYIEDSYIPRRITNYIYERIMLEVAEHVDDPLNMRLIEDVLAKLNQFGTGLVGRGAVLGFNASFYDENNPVADLAAGKIVFTVTLLPAREASEIVIDLLIDLNLLGF